MKKIIKFILLGMAAVLALAVAGATYFALTFNPNDYKAKIIQAVKDSKQRNLRLDSDIKLSFFPNIGAQLSKVSLSEFKSDKEFAAVESVRVSLALLPLLSGRVVVDEVALNGLKATLIKRKDGTTNIDDLLGKDEVKADVKQPDEQKKASAQVKFDIAAVSITTTNLTYRDEASGAQYAIKDLNLHTGRIAAGVPSKINLSLGVQANKPKLDISAQLKTTLTFDLDKQKYQLTGLDVQVSGTALDISNLNIKVSGDASADLPAQAFGAQKLSVHATGLNNPGQKNKVSFDATVNAPQLSVVKNKLSADKLTLNAKLDGAFGNVIASLSLPGVTANEQTFKISALALDVDVKQPEQTFKMKLNSPVSGSISAQQINLSDLVIALQATGDKLPNKSVSSEMKGSVQVDAKKETVQANFSGGLLQSKVKAKIGVKSFAKPAISFDVDVDQFDADLYLPKTPATAAAPKAKEPEQPLDLSALRTLDLDGSLRIGALKVANVKSSQLRVDVKARDGLLTLNPLSANLYQGSVSGSLSVNAQATPSVSIKQNMTGINIAPLLMDALQLDMLEGKGNVVVDIAVQGNTVSAMKKSAQGSLSLNLADGAVKGINLPKLVQGVQSLGKSSTMQTLGMNKDEKTAFSEFKASFKVNKGVAHNDDLAVQAPMLRITGSGDVDIGNDSLNYTTKATLSKTEGGGTATLPVHLSGTFTDLKYKVDFGAMLVDVAKQKIEAKKEEVKAKVKEDAKARLQEELQKGLKGLFK